MVNNTEVTALQKFLDTQPKIVVIAHGNPDGDTIGASAGIAAGLRQLGHDITLACIDPSPDAFGFVVGTDEYVQDFDENTFDGVFFCDCAESYMSKFSDSKERLLSGDMTAINLDHHPTNNNFGDINFVEPGASSSCELALELLENLNIKITPDIATALLLGLYTDTGSFMHQNTTPEAYAAAAKLVRAGGNVAKIAKRVFHNNEFRTFKLWGRVLKNLHLTDDGAAVIGVHQQDYESLGASRQDLNGIIDWVSSMPEARYSALLSEDGKGNVKASLRTRKNDVDVKALAEEFGGGGHVKAAGFTVRGGHLQKEIKWKIIQE